MNALRASHFHIGRMAGMQISNEPNKCGQLCNGLQLNGEKTQCFSMAFYFSSLFKASDHSLYWLSICVIHLWNDPDNPISPITPPTLSNALHVTPPTLSCQWLEKQDRQTEAVRQDYFWQTVVRLEAVEEHSTLPSLMPSINTDSTIQRARGDRHHDPAAMHVWTSPIAVQTQTTWDCLTAYFV